jgi:hypothetical protein
LFFCTARSMSLTTLLESELAVFEIRSVHRWPGLFISAGQQLSSNVRGSYEMLTFQTYDRWRSLKLVQKMFLEGIFHVIVGVRRITKLILQLHLDFPPELIILREHGYHRNLNNPSCQLRFIKPCLDVPFLSGQILSMCFRSSDGRSLSIGMQYLKSKPCKYGTVDSEKHKPYRVQSTIQ